MGRPDGSWIRGGVSHVDRRNYIHCDVLRARGIVLRDGTAWSLETGSSLLDDIMSQGDETIGYNDVSAIHVIIDRRYASLLAQFPLMGPREGWNGPTRIEL